jgi:phosphohistidine phosphatase
MLRLTLVRHAKAEPALDDQEDWDRALDPRGSRDAPEMARRLKGSAPKPDRALTSPAVRAVATATIFARELNIPAKTLVLDERLYLASPPDLLTVVREQGGNAKHVIVFAHNPGITEFADKLSSERSIDNMPTCAVYTLEFEIENWSELAWSSGVNADLDYPNRA